MGSPEIHLVYDIAHVKVDFIMVSKMFVIPVGRFVWTTYFEQCDAGAAREAQKPEKQHRAWGHIEDSSITSS